MKNSISMALAFVLLAGCVSKSDNVPSTNGSTAAPTASSEYRTPDAPSRDALQEVGLLLIDSKLNAELSMMQLKLILQGAKSKGGPNTVPELWAASNDRAREVQTEYKGVITKLPDGELRSALKECFAAEIRFYEALSAPNTADRRWLPAIHDAKEQRDIAASKVDAELQLARS